MKKSTREGQEVVDASRRVSELEHELAEARACIATLQEQQDVSRAASRAINAEGHSANEELQDINDNLESTNDNLESTNESLESTNENLESTNEDLNTLNDEIGARNAELVRLNNHLLNLESTVHTAIVLLDRELSVRRFTPLAEKAFNLLAHDVGRSLGTVQFDFDFPELIAWVKTVIETRTAREQEVQDNDGRWYSLRARPYITTEDEVDGAVLMLLDIDALVRSKRELKDTGDYADAIVEQVSPLLVLDKDLRVIRANRSFLQHFQVPADQVEDRLVYDLGNGQWDIAALRKALEKVLPEKGILEGFEVEHDFETIGKRMLFLNARQLERTQKILLSIEDITERREAERIITEENHTLELRVAERTAEIRKHVEQLHRVSLDLADTEHRERRRLAVILHDDLQQILVGTKVHAMTAFGPGGSVEKAAFVQDLLSQAIETTRSLAKELAPTVLYEKGLVAGLHWLSRWAERRYGLQVEVTTDEGAEPDTLPVRVYLFEGVRELLLNIVKHAGTDRAHISLTHVNGTLRLLVEDFGDGFQRAAGKVPAEEQGSGLLSMQERLALMGGEMIIDSAPGRGTRVEIGAPLKRTYP